jgi:hypothetical protein
MEVGLWVDAEQQGTTGGWDVWGVAAYPTINNLNLSYKKCKNG